jgi:hypothetical protein
MLNTNNNPVKVVKDFLDQEEDSIADFINFSDDSEDSWNEDYQL